MDTYETEAAVIGAAIVDLEARAQAATALSAEHFATPLFREALKILKEVGSQDVDILYLWSQIPPHVQRQFSQDELVNAARTAPLVITDKITAIRDLSVRRLVRAQAQRIATSSDGVAVEELLRSVHNLSAHAEQRATAGRNRMTMLSGLVGERVSEFESGVAINKMPTGLSALDRLLIGGLTPSEMTIIAARPGMGKTALMLNMLLNMSKDNKQVVMFTLEMSEAQIADRLLSIHSGTELQHVIQGHAGLDTLRAARNQLSNLRAWIDTTPGISPEYIRSSLHRLISLHGVQPEVVFVDYIHLMSAPAGFHIESRTRELGATSQTLKGLAKEFDVAMVVASQLSRECEKRQDKRPLLSDLRASGSLEQDADNVMFLYRDAVYNEGANEHIAEINVAKQRQGPTGTVHVGCALNVNRFMNLAVEDDDSYQH